MKNFTSFGLRLTVKNISKIQSQPYQWRVVNQDFTLEIVIDPFKMTQSCDYLMEKEIKIIDFVATNNQFSRSNSEFQLGVVTNDKR